LDVNRAPSKSNISYQSKHWDSELFRAYYSELIRHLGKQVAFRQVKFRIKARIVLLDPTTISLCPGLFDQTRYKTAKGAVKMHTLLDFEQNLPAYANPASAGAGRPTTKGPPASP